MKFAHKKYLYTLLKTAYLDIVENKFKQFEKKIKQAKVYNKMNSLNEDRQINGAYVHYLFKKNNRYY